jgi:general nucleoside transport system permease protein
MNKVVKQIFSPSALVTVLAVLASFLIGGLLIAFANEDVQATSGYLFARPTDFLSAVWNAVFGAYDALFRGSIFNYKAMDSVGMIKPLTETLTYATPITLAGLGMAVAFRSGLFNIGGTGQIIFGAMGAAWVGFSLELPAIIHLPVAVIAGILASALFGGFVGFLKAATGANEVIVTIMMNYIASLLLFWILTTPLFQAPNATNPISPEIAASAKYWRFMGDDYRINAAFFVMLAMVATVWWLLNRSSIGFQFRALGHNPNAAKTAGINIGVTYVLVMAVSGALAGLAGTAQVLGAEKYLTPSVAASFGFDAITVALLGRSKPLGVLAAGVLFGALRAGAVIMQANQKVPIDIVLIVQSLVVLFIAAPPLVRFMFRVPDLAKKQAEKKQVAA